MTRRAPDLDLTGLSVDQALARIAEQVDQYYNDMQRQLVTDMLCRPEGEIHNVDAAHRRGARLGRRPLAEERARILEEAERWLRMTG
jgi:hypothetical protein